MSDNSDCDNKPQFTLSRQGVNSTPLRLVIKLDPDDLRRLRIFNQQYGKSRF